MRSLAPYIFFAGWLTAAIAQIYMVIQAFRHSFMKGLLCLIIPGYVLIHATKRETKESKALICWVVGLLALVFGLVAS
ncbi:hypothetical protein [Leptolyngbya sp. PCC 6406]|uniref:hypothetical protein n=1 Tax=Leptolyngbya sp. PCC 6406 TaxID=1173264 RepID=UPI0012DBEE38|nr:hypothetical protein [Leptolyngbya sp. PCC 6406]